MKNILFFTIFLTIVIGVLSLDSRIDQETSIRNAKFNPFLKSLIKAYCDVNYCYTRPTLPPFTISNSFPTLPLSPPTTPIQQPVTFQPNSLNSVYPPFYNGPAPIQPNFNFPLYVQSQNLIELFRQMLYQILASKGWTYSFTETFSPPTSQGSTFTVSGSYTESGTSISSSVGSGTSVSSSIGRTSSSVLGTTATSSYTTGTLSSITSSTTSGIRNSYGSITSFIPYASKSISSTTSSVSSGTSSGSSGFTTTGYGTKDFTITGGSSGFTTGGSSGFTTGRSVGFTSDEGTTFVAVPFIQNDGSITSVSFANSPIAPTETTYDSTPENTADSLDARINPQSQLWPPHSEEQTNDSLYVNQYPSSQINLNDK